MASTTEPTLDHIADLLGADANELLDHSCETIDRSLLHLPGPDFIERVLLDTDRSTATIATCGGCSSTAASAGPAMCPSCRSTRGSSTPPAPALLRTRLLRSREHRQARDRGRLQRRRLDARRARRRVAQYAHRIPFIVKLNHNELLTYPNKFDQILFAQVKQAWDMGAAASAPRSTSARDESHAPDRGRSSRPLSMPTSSGWPPSCGATCATPRSRQTRTTTSPPTSPARRIISASPLRPTSSSRSCPRTTAATAS